MKLACFWPPARRALCALSLALALCAFPGCNSHPQGAPHSSIPRENALALAQLTADSVKGQVFTIAPTGSMKPTLDENSVVAVEIVAFSQLRQGDIVIYRSTSGQPIVHRLYAPSKSGWTVLGDNNGAPDLELVTEGNVLGRVCAIFYTTPGAAHPVTTAVARR